MSIDVGTDKENVVHTHKRISCVRAKSLQSCPTLCDPMDCSLQGSSVDRILQARILGYIAMPCSRGSSRSWDRTCISYVSGIGRQVLLPLYHQFFTTGFTTKASWCFPGEYYSIFKMKEILQYATWMKLEVVMLSKMS